jgi:hypothetical protein
MYPLDRMKNRSIRVTVMIRPWNINGLGRRAAPGRIALVMTTANIGLLEDGPGRGMGRAPIALPSPLPALPLRAIDIAALPNGDVAGLHRSPGAPVVAAPPGSIDTRTRSVGDEIVLALELTRGSTTIREIGRAKGARARTRTKGEVS